MQAPAPVYLTRNSGLSPYRAAKQRAWNGFSYHDCRFFIFAPGLFIFLSGEKRSSLGARDRLCTGSKNASGDDILQHFRMANRVPTLPENA
jgi:hypothetical protein